MLSALDIEEINKQNSRGQAALYCAARRNHRDFVIELLQLEGINVNCQARTHGSTPLHGASFGGYANIVALLLAAGADPKIENYPESPGAPPLTPREEARGDAIKAYMSFEQGGIDALAKIEPYVLKLRQVLNNESAARKVRNEELSDIQSREDIIKDNIQFEGIVHWMVNNVREKRVTWREVNLVIFLESEVIRFAWFLVEAKKGEDAVKPLSVTALERNKSVGCPCGIIRDTSSYSTSDPFPLETMFFIFTRENPRSLPVKHIFSAVDLAARENILTIIYYLMNPISKRLLNFGQSKAQHIEKWRKLAAEKLFIVSPEQEAEHAKKTDAPRNQNEVHSVISTEDEMATLIQLIEDITEEDVYHNTSNSLKTTTATMQRGDPLREVLTEMIEIPRPHDMIDWSGKDDPFKPLIDFSSRVSEIMKNPKIPKPLFHMLKKYQGLYTQLVEAEGALPRPTLLRSGEAKIGSRIVPRSAELIISDPNADTERGIHRVVRVGNVFFKVSPSAPAYEMAVGQLNQVIWHEGTALALIVRLELPNEKLVCQAAAAVDGVLLGDFLAGAPDLVPYLNHESLTLQYLAGSLYRPNDGKLDNIMVAVEHISKSPMKRMKLVCIDNDESFADEFSETKAGHDLTIRYSAWLLPQTRTRPGSQYDPSSLIMNRKACNELLAHSAEFIVIRLMVFLYYQSKKCYDLYDEGVITKEELVGDPMVNNYGLVALFRDGEAKRLLKDIRKAQTIVRSPVVTFEEFLEAMFPEVAYVYQFANLAVKDDLSNFGTIVEEHLFGFGRPCLEKIPDLVQAYPDLPARLQKFHAKPASWVYERKNAPEVEISCLLQEMDFEGLPTEDHYQILYDIIKIPLASVTIRNSAFFNIKHVEELLNRRSMKRLHLINCSSISDDNIRVVRARCEQSQQSLELIIENCDLVSPTMVHQSAVFLTVTVKGCTNATMLLKQLVSWAREPREKEPPNVSQEIKNVLIELDSESGKSFLETSEKLQELLKHTSGDEKEGLIAIFNFYSLPVIAVANGDEGLLKFLYEYMGDENELVREGRSALYEVATKYGQERVLISLLKEAAPSALTFKMMTSTMEAQMVEATKFIIEQNVSLLDKVNSKGESALFMACRLGGKVLRLAEFILQKAPELCNKPSQNGQSPLHVACSLRERSLVTLLIQHGASLDTQDRQGETPLSIAIFDYRNSVVIIDDLLRAGGSLTLNTLLPTIKNGDYENIRELLKKQKRPLSSYTNDEGQTLLHVSANLEFIQYVTKEDTSLIHVQDKNGVTPLMELCTLLGPSSCSEDKQIQEMVRYLMSLGADINHFNKEGLNVLHRALLSTDERIKRRLPHIVNTLLNFGVDIGKPTQNDEALGTLYVAMKSANIQVFRIICRHVLKNIPKESIKTLVGPDFAQKAAEQGGFFQGEAQRLLKGEGVVFAPTASS
eukprot:TRINITY_DN7476_c0_g1_i1.p1 TRINITY_DN7476_c0_g1~~TRINITY_DN7476_c0_g1_i1.p1  ORF type:complete len:1472 (-),score=285.61 TRINITY_DN7476_c0_g1_i1:92-4390(-)